MFKEENGVRISKTPKIQKVIFLLRDHKEFVKYYEPRVVSLGPIHHGNEKYQLAETFKRKLAKVFVDSSGKTIEEICKAVDGKIKELRECFEEEVTKKYNDVDLAWILVIDGCAILQYIDLAISDKFKDSGIKNDSVAYCQQDLFLLENQVPYALLEMLMKLSKVEKALRNSVKEFIKRNHHMVLMDNSSGPQPEKPSENPTHLLDLLRSSLLGPENAAKKDEKTEVNLPTNQEAPKASNNERTTHSSNGTKTNPQRSSDRQSCRTVQELKAAGIHVKRSEANSLRNISFSTKLINYLPGVLSLPPLIVDDSTGPRLLNLIAYEMCLDFDNDFGITSYVSFLDSLIDEANDVKELRKAHVLFNLLGSDKEVAKLFNEIGTDLVPDLAQHKQVRTQIQEYYDKKWGKWLGEFVHTHCRSPWTVLAFLGALLALALSATQTWYAVDSPPGPCDKFCEKFNQNFRKGY
ncbi:hypothetical protein I3842_10G037600 [Carya illinoinensis]|uniref:Uncharacterized protein n=1 Tax=Carya illinoinensis TaxID=32201 RepID=A0A922DUE9_CARIL|nr:hypothetical protein I3842_10G037600 [Carya illinoinensis]